MKNRFHYSYLASAIAAGLLLCSVGAQAAGELSADQRKTSLYQLADLVASNYVFPDKGAQLASEIRKRADQDAYKEVVSPQAFAERLGKDLQVLSHDKHFRVNFAPEFVPDAKPFQGPTAAEITEIKGDAAMRAFGIGRLERLPGNIGFLEIRGFGPTFSVAKAYEAAMLILSGTDGLILDLRRNHGGSPESVALLMSYFFPEGDNRLINSIYNRPENSTRAFWTQDNLQVRYAGKVAVLTSSDTFSGGEECAYDFQTHQRGVVVGETSGGGANPVAPYSIKNGLVAAIPFGRAVNPVTGTNWEGKGVQPDIRAKAADALPVAYQHLLQQLLEKPRDDEHRDTLKKTLEKARSPQTLFPVYYPG